MGTGRVVVVGGGVGGLAVSLALARAGTPVVLLERDVLPEADDAEAAFAAARQGAPQAHQTHGFLARVVTELRDHLPDVLDDLLDAGCFTLPTTANLGEARPGDDDLRVLVVRRTTFEWVLRRAVLRQPGIDVATGVGVRGLLGGKADVHGVALEDGSLIEADAVIAATGRRGPVGAWLQGVGVEMPETIAESGLMYMTRWYRLPEGFGDFDPKLGGDLGFLKYLAVPGDGRTLSVTLAIRSDDAELRAALSNSATFDQACRLVPGPDQFFARGPLEAMGGVRPMGGLLNRLRRFTDDEGRPTVVGFHAVGDAHTCTNPLYGRGCSLALVQAFRLADAFAAHPHDRAARAAAYEAASAREVEPWFEVSVQMDKMGADPRGLGGGSDEAQAMGRVFAAAATDPVIGRALVRFWNLLALPADLAADPEFVARTAEVVANPDAYPLPPRIGPTRAELLAALASSSLERRVS